MTMFYPPSHTKVERHESGYTRIKMERSSPDEDDDRSRLNSASPGIPITTVMTANENWRG
jgi:hypothetical protein